MKRIAADKLVPSYDRANQVNLRVAPGEEIVVETHDRFSKWMNSDSAPDLSDPALMGITGAIYVEGALPGTTLQVEILDVQLTSDVGLVDSIPGKGAFGKSIPAFTMERADIVGDKVHFLGFELPLRPMVGRIGVAPAGEPAHSVTAGAHGGNLDVKEVAAGATVLLPVFVDGALLAIGDLHAAMGDGEVNIGAVEAVGNVTIRCSVLHDWPLEHPMILTPTHLVALGSAPSLDEAAVVALESMRHHVCRRLGLSRVHAGMLLSVAADLGVGQIVNPAKTAKVSIPREYLESQRK